ncbi:hypothetical protein [Amycolatopsis sp. NPDC049868]|uniref:hypothetical protein n=1 Tax=Amycolatopsis sp. NPDC049868 TaxID=3363934 RepID=UPI00379ADA5C
MVDLTPLGGPIPTGGGAPPITPDQAAAMGKLVKEAVTTAFNAVYPPETREALKRELTGVKAEVNGVTSALNLVKVEWTAFKLEPPSIWEIIQQRRAKARGEAPEQLKALGDSAKKRANDAHRLAQSANQNAGTALRKANQVGTGVQQGITARLNPISQSISTLRGQVTRLDRRAAAIGRETTAALQGVRRVGTDQNRLTQRIATLERRQQTGQGGRGQDAAALRREGDRTRQALRDLTAAMRGTGPGSQQFKRQIEAIEQSLR